MKINLNYINELKSICHDYPNYDIEDLRAKSISDPRWIAFGSGNIFRGYIAKLNQDLINKGLCDRGISVVESFDEEIISKVYKTNDNLCVSVTLNKDGNFTSSLIGNLAESLILSQDNKRIVEIFKNENLQIISYTITEKGYNLYNPSGELLDIVKEDMEKEPENSNHLMAKSTYYLYERYKANKKPITMLSLDNCSKNGDKLKSSILHFANAWIKTKKIEKEFLDYLNDRSKVSFPWTMIDKITPRPAKEVEDYLKGKGLEDINTVITSKKSYVAPFVNSEEAQYLVIEDDFTNGRDDYSKVGVYLTDRETVNKVETMKVTTCLNPLHTTLAVYGCLLGYESISKEMEDQELVQLIKNIGYKEALKVVVDPKILNPKDFIDEVINIRLPNPYIPDTPQRIATDTSQKVAIRFGETIKSYVKENKVEELRFIPLALAGWLRYLIGLDDNLNKFELSPDPLMKELKEIFEVKELKDIDINEVSKLLENEMIFGLNLKEVGLNDIIITYFKDLIRGKGAVRETLKKYLG